MRGALLTLPVAFILLVPTRGGTQPDESFHGLSMRVNIGDRLQVEDASGARTTGRLVALTDDVLTLSTDVGTGVRRVTPAGVRTITLRQHPTVAGVRIGAGVGLLAGALAACAGADRSECIDGPLVLGSLGAGLGLATGALISRSTVVYPLRPDDAWSENGTDQPGPFDTLALRVNRGDRLRVESTDRRHISGRLTRLTGTALWLETPSGELRFEVRDVRDVKRRTHGLARGALIGAGAFTLVVASAPACRSNDDCQPWAAAPVGAGLGLAVAALIPHTTTVYRKPGLGLALSPLITRHAVALQARMRW